MLLELLEYCLVDFPDQYLATCHTLTCNEGKAWIKHHLGDSANIYQVLGVLTIKSTGFTTSGCSSHQDPLPGQAEYMNR